MDILLIGIVCYLMGSIPFGFILTKIFLKKNHELVTETHVLLKPKNIKSKNHIDLHEKKSIDKSNWL